MVSEVTEIKKKQQSNYTLINFLGNSIKIIFKNVDVSRQAFQYSYAQ